MAFSDWLETYKKIHAGTAREELACPDCSERGVVDFQYVGDPLTRIGFMVMWCANCSKGIRLSRVGIPPNWDMLNFDDRATIAKRIPTFEEVVPK